MARHAKLAGRRAKCGGAFVTSFKLPDLCGEDVLILVERLCELGYSLDSVIEILDKPAEKKIELIL